MEFTRIYAWKAIMPSLVASTMLAGCSIYMVRGHLYPVQGSLAAQSPAPIYNVTLNGVMNSGTISVTLQGDEACSGQWAPVPQDDPSASRMSAEWDRIYGNGFFVANILGNPSFARAIATGPKGSTLNIEFYAPIPGRLDTVKGIAADNNGNIFKITF